jgi:hypothetical protein
LEIEGVRDEPHTVHCPRKDRDMPLRACLGCKRYHSLAIDPSGMHVYLDCDWVGADAVRAGNAAPESSKANT